MKHLHLIVLLVSSVGHAETIVGKFSGFGTHGIPEVAPALEELSETGFQNGDVIAGSFAYQSDSPIQTELLPFYPGGNIYRADYLRIQLGDRIVENVEDMVVFVSSRGPLPHLFSVSNRRSLSDFSVDRFAFGIHALSASPVTSNDLPTSNDDVDGTQRWFVQALGVSFDFEQENFFTIGPITCDASTGGDIDGNGLVDFADFLILADNFGTEVDSHELGDIDCSGLVDFADFLRLSANFGSIQVVSEVPEPNAASLGLFALLSYTSVLKRANFRFFEDIRESEAETVSPVLDVAST